MITNKDKCVFINDCSDYWVMTPEQALVELSKELSNVEIRINKYGIDDFYNELDMADALSEAIDDPVRYVAIGREYVGAWEPITQDELDTWYKECKESD